MDDALIDELFMTVLFVDELFTVELFIDEPTAEEFPTGPFICELPPTSRGADPPETEELLRFRSPM